MFKIIKGAYLITELPLDAWCELCAVKRAMRATMTTTVVLAVLQIATAGAHAQ
jgi:hypothetical protein